MSNGLDSSPPLSISRRSFHFFAGLLSGLSTSVLLQPADLLKTRVQQHASGNTSSPLLSVLRDVISSPSPIKQLWRGTLPSAIRTGAGSALYFGGLDWMRRLMLTNGWGVAVTTTTTTTANSTKGEKKKAQLSHTANLLTGAFSRAAAGFAMMPITVLKVRYESSLYAYGSLSAATADIWRAEGARGFFSGFGATAVRDAPYAGLYVLFYEAGKRKLRAWTSHLKRPKNDDDAAAMAAALAALPEGLSVDMASSSASINFVSGIFAAGLATAITNPFDAIKTRLQLMPQRYGNMIKAGRMMLLEEGWRSLFHGLGLRMGRKGMSSALAWTVYEELVRRAEIRWLREKENIL